MRWEQQVIYASISDVGLRRQNNQDSHVIQICSDYETWREHGHLFVVADGMGGHAVGELASKIAVDTIPQAFFKSKVPEIPRALRTALETANAAIHERGTANQDFLRMGTTCSGLVLSRGGAIVGHVGDSRVYRIRQGKIEQLSFDHSLQWELLKRGQLHPDEAFLFEPRHVITRSLGPEPKVQVDVEGPFPIESHDVYLLCSDGLTTYLQDHEIGMVASHLSAPEACRFLVHLANLRGGSDNITVVIVRVGQAPGEPHLSELDEDPEPVIKGESVSGWWLGGIWASTLLMVLGICLFFLREPISGFWLVLWSVLAMGGLLAWRLWNLTRGSEPVAEELMATGSDSPYRTASARLTRKFLNHVAAIEAELQRTASDEGWRIDWNSHEEAYQRAQSAIADKAYPQILSAYARAIDVLMAGVLLNRKQLQQDSRKGKLLPIIEEPES
ncbi:MAG: protein phosphatase 2C domain-containing protein [Planctomycetota bacterium]|nr:protein phosphatase 2C domain-containing protein [Planctomycetota bacterium]MDA1213307.1 protein phosphatase 2C domain-containing protein [Planctomycetota bacterium]